MSVDQVFIVNSFDGGEMYVSYLRYRSIQVRLFKRPEEALEKASSAPPDVIVTDVMFMNSDFDGPAFIQRLRQLPPTATVPIIVISGWVRESDRRLVRKAGADRFLMKPCLPEVLLNEVKAAILAKRRRERLRWNWATATHDRRRQERRQAERRRHNL